MGRTIILARQVWAGDPPAPDADALIIDGERIEWVGARDALPRRRPGAGSTWETPS